MLVEVSAAAVLEAIARQRACDLILTEGGPQLLGEFLKERLLDELFLTLAPQVTGRDGYHPSPGLCRRRAFRAGAAGLGNPAGYQAEPEPSLPALRLRRGFLSPPPVPADLQAALARHPDAQNMYTLLASFKQKQLIDQIEHADGEAARGQAMERVIRILRATRPETSFWFASCEPVWRLSKDIQSSAKGMVPAGNFTSAGWGPVYTQIALVRLSLVSCHVTRAHGISSHRQSKVRARLARPLVVSTEERTDVRRMC